MCCNVVLAEKHHINVVCTGGTREADGRYGKEKGRWWK